MRSFHETRSRWDTTFAQITSISDLRNAVKEDGNQNPCISGLRSICWKAFLLYKDDDQSTWPKILSDSRSAYASLKEHFLKDIGNPDDLSSEDPLANTETSPWNTLRLDEELRAEICLDVERCMPDNLYFREPITQNTLLDILFVYCKLNKDIGYRQGMHEVLAPIVWVVSRDVLDVNDLGSHRADLDKAMIVNADPAYIEHDAFSLFAAIMQTVKTFYEMGGNNEPPTSGLLNNSPIVERSKRIHENYLLHADPELAEHLTAIEILPQIFLIRWIRLLFGREFPFDDVLALWDLLFAEDPGLDLVDFISVAMLLRIRWQLLEADYSAALTLLLRYPVPSSPYGPPSFVADALYLRENLMLDGGDHIIAKYSRRAPETTVTRKVPKKIKRARTADQEAAQKIVSPKKKPTKIFHEQGGIEGIIHEAAKGVYNQGERWGVAKALRGAVQGLQSGHNSPRRVSGSRLSAEDNKATSLRPDEMIAKIQSSGERNKSLAKLLGNAVEELWSQQHEIHQKTEAVVDGLSLAIAKVQFVQVYLENSTMPLPTDTSHSEQSTNQDNANAVKEEKIVTPQKSMPRLISAHRDDPAEGHLTNSTSGKRPTVIAEQSSTAQINSLPSTPTASSPSKPSSPPPRPSLDKSPFSWMLGEDEPKTGFIPPSPFRPERSGGHTNHLFGDTENTSRKSGLGTAGKEGEREDGNEDGNDVFGMSFKRSGA